MNQSPQMNMYYPVALNPQPYRVSRKTPRLPKNNSLLIVAILVSILVIVGIIALIVVYTRNNGSSDNITRDSTPTQIILPTYTPFPTGSSLLEQDDLQISTLPLQEEALSEEPEEEGRRIPGRSLTLNTNSERIVFQSNIAQSDNDAIMKVGKETLYQADLQYQLPYIVSINNQQARATVIEALKSESIILQSGAEEGIISLNNAVFNNKTKNYTQRENLVQRVRTAIENDSAIIQGKILSMWFYTGDNQAMSYAQSQEYVHKQIQDIHNRLSQRTLSIENAAKEITSDSSLKNIDPLYQQNAIFAFEAHDGDDITIFPEVNDIIWSLDINEISDIMTGNTAYEDEQQREAVYMIAVITDKQNPNDATTFDEWYSTHEDTYNVTLY